MRDLENELDKVGGHSAAEKQASDSELGAGRSGSVRAEELRRQAPGPGTELASYCVSGGERLLICALGKGGLEILDVAADFLGPTYRVDRALEDETALWAVVDDYLAQAKRFDAPPMSGAALRTLMLKPHD